MTKQSRLIKKIFVIIIFVNTACVFSQTVCGIDISDPNNISGYNYNNSLDAAGTDVYIKNDPGLFDRVLLNKGLGYVCTVNYPTANRFVELYDDIVKNLGYENENKDIIPKNLVGGDIIDICLLISDGEAQIIRFWYEKKFNIKLAYTKENLQLYISYF